jgi:dihydroorotate dehydrogenase
MYNLIKPILFKFDAEKTHDIALKTSQIASVSLLNPVYAGVFSVQDKALEVDVCGLTFKNPVGLAAGFDKNAEGLKFLAQVGFGHVEIGSVTLHPQEGNPKPRLARLPDSNALLNSMGFPSKGAKVVADNLRRVFTQIDDVVIGVNIGKSRITSIEDAKEDYLETFTYIEKYAHYVALNVSSPNTPELRTLQEKGRLNDLFKTIRAKNARRLPLFVKLAPDLTPQELDDIIEVILENEISGVIATNTTLSRDNLTLEDNAFCVERPGGISGVPLKQKSLQVIRYLYSKLQGKVPIIGVGGVFNSNDVVEFIRAGASLIQIYTVLIYNGPFFVKKLNTDILAYLKREGLKSVQELIGKQ